MHPTRPGPRRVLAGAAGLAVAATGLSLVPSTASANSAGTGLVINEVYGAGGNNGAVYNADYVELFNPTDEPLTLDGLSLQYRSAGGSHGANPFGLTGTVAPGAHFLVQMSNVGSNGAALPTPDATASPAFSMAAAGGQVFLVEGTTRTALTGDVAGAAGVVDMVGFTSSSTTFEGAPATGASAAQSAHRTDGADTDVNAADFSLAAPTPQPSGGGTDPGDPGEPEEPAALSIAEIQGTGATTPVAGDEVVTEGVVTAAYPSGGLFGFYLQTAGTGGALDLAAHRASQAVFVYHSRSAGAVSVEPGDHVRVTGVAGEYAGLTQLTVDAAADVVELATPAAAVQPAVTAWPETDAEKESLEGMLFAAGEHEFTITNTYATNQYGEVGLALGDRPLLQPTAVADAQDAAAIAVVVADNAARAITLDDGASTNFTASSYTACGARPVPCLLNGDLTPAYVSQDEPVRVGAAAEFTAPVILTQGGSPSSPTYRFQPTATVVGPDNAASPATFENTRTAAPDQALIEAEGTADVTVASFNVLNYFTTVADADDDGAADGTCVGYYDRDDDGVTVRDDCDIRGAWDPQDLARQQEKIVSAINALDASAVGLMEIENSAKLGEEADEATRTLVAALNAAAGYEKWAANPSSSELPPVAQQDVITNAIIYQPAVVQRSGEARALGTLSAEGQAFDNAREPLAQAFEPAGGGEPFLVVVNHFKSKGSGVDDGTGQGNANPDRIAQAEALAAWVPGVQAEEGVEATLLLGDFNSYAQEDPLQVLYDAGYTSVEEHSGAGEYSYSYQGLSGSLDHVLANDAAMELYTGADIWNINAGESLALEYSRWNYHATDFHRADPYRSSDHDPVIVGLDLPDSRTASSIEVDVVPRRVFAQLIPVLLRIEVTTEQGRATGHVEVSTEGRTVRVPLLRGHAIALLRPFATPGTKTVTVSYPGDDDTQGSQTTVEIEVLKRPGR